MNTFDERYTEVEGTPKDIIVGGGELAVPLSAIKKAMEGGSSSLNTYKSGYDPVNKIYTIVEHRRLDGTLYQKSELFDLVGKVYTSRFLETFEADGVTHKGLEIFTLTYDEDGNLVSEELR